MDGHVLAAEDASKDSTASRRVLIAVTTPAGDTLVGDVVRGE
jgi:hypothetical protein